MGLRNFINLLGGLALFIYGMQMMENGLQEAAGKKLHKILAGMTANPFIGVLAGTLVTALIQSSTAVTVMTVGFVNAGMMTLLQSVWIIMGANIGTTITGQLIAMDAGVMAPFLAFCGVVLLICGKRKGIKQAGTVLAGMGVLFIGLQMMEASMLPLRESPAFLKLMSRFRNPLWGILGGTVFTALIQSSTASVGILQAMAEGGAVSLCDTVYVLFGQNIGTCLTSMLAAVGTGCNAKRSTLIHLLFNVIGTVLFTILCVLLPVCPWVEQWTPDNPAAQIANMHTLMNVGTTFLLLPFGKQLAELTERLLPDKETRHRFQ